VKLIANCLICLLTLLCLSPTAAQSEADAATIVLEQIEITDQPKLGLTTIANLDLSKASPARRVELALLGADYALAQRRFDLVPSYLDMARASWDTLAPPDRAMAGFLHLTLQQKSNGLIAPGQARKNLLNDLEKALEMVEDYEVTTSENSPWVCTHLLIGRAFGYWVRELVEHQLLLDEDLAPVIRRVKQRAQEVALKWATTQQSIPTLAVSHGYLRELLEAQETLDPSDPLYASLGQQEHLAQVLKIAKKRGAGQLVEAALERLEAYRRLYQVRRMADESWGRTYTQSEALQVKTALMEAFNIAKDQASLRLTAELFVTSFEASLASVKPGWMEVARKRFLAPPNFVKNYPTIMARYFVARARFHLLDNEAKKAAEDAQMAVDIYQAWFQEAGFSDEGLTSVRREASKAYETLIEAQLRSNDTQGAFTTAADFQVLEGLSVLALRGGDDAFGRVTAASAARSLQPGEALILYFPGRLRLYSFLVTQENLQAEQIPITSSQLQGRVLKHLRAIRTLRSTQADSQELHQLLLGRYQLKDLRALHIAPSSFLANLPWGSLTNPQGQPLSTSHSCLVRLAFSDQAQPQGPPGRLRAIGNPDGTLPMAEVEVQEISALITPSDFEVGAKATREFVDSFSSGVMHFATHGVVNYRKPQSSHLLLAADEHLTAREIAQGRWPQATLVVLSACNTGASQFDIIGHRSLAGAFLKAGAPVVLATLWPVDDQATQVFMKEFYTVLAAGRTPQDSLRAAQNKLQENPNFNHPYYWSGFVLFEV
jgi:hypothetical protein